MSQSKRGSLVEAFTNTAIGLSIAFTAQSTIAWANGIPLSAHDNLVLTFWMTIVSIVRSYVIRRWFNKRNT